MSESKSESQTDALVRQYLDSSNFSSLIADTPRSRLQPQRRTRRLNALELTSKPTPTTLS
jgi:hypothetical protein